jgi:isoamylase
VSAEPSRHSMGTDAVIAAWPGRPFPLGASYDGGGTNVAVWSSTADSVAVALFDADGAETLVPLTERTYGIWHGYLPGVGPGQRYGFRLDGPFDPGQGLLHQPRKLLLDPYARAVEGDFVDHPDAYLSGTEDSAGYVPRSVITDDDFDWAGDVAPRTDWADTVIYELHVKGFTQRMPSVPEALRGTYAGLGHPAAVDYLAGLGVTAVELMPVHFFVTEAAVQRRGMRNYWGYNSVGYFATHPGYAAATDPAAAISEFKSMVRALHGAGIEVILDVVYNHTGEGNEHGPVLSFKGIDNRGYYRLDPIHPAQYLDFTGCGNTVDVRQPFALQLVMDSLRYWVQEMHVDGFRFDLAAALARAHFAVDRLSAFLQAVHQDPVVSSVKLIAEPWDVGAGGYQLGEFPPPWTEWNGRFRDTLREFWVGGAGGVRDLAYRLSGSSDLYGDDGRLPYASINFVTAHDGFTLRDLLSYSHKHNEPNGEDNQDGFGDNRSANYGVEGATDDEVILAVRLRQARNLLTTVLLSAGVPMVCAGDERWRTQHGNNNAYVQDNETSWLDWKETDQSADLTELTRTLIALRRRSPVLRQPAFFAGHEVAGGDGCKDLAWFDASGAEMDGGHWFHPSVQTIGMYLDGRGLRHRDPQNQMIIDDSYLLVLHAADHPAMVTLPAAPWAGAYQPVIDTANPGGRADETARLAAGERHQIDAQTTWLLRVVR